MRGARGILVVETVGYKPEVRGFEIRWGEILNLRNWVPETLKKILFLGSKLRRVREADKCTAIYEPII
jgi:hypothetical protein